MKGRMSHATIERAEDKKAEAKETREERDAEHRRGGRVAHRRRHGGKVEGSAPAHRLDKRARGGKFIAKATEGAHGQLKAKAEKAGLSTEAFAKKEEHAPGKLGKEARLAETLERVRPKKK